MSHRYLNLSLAFPSSKTLEPVEERSLSPSPLPSPVSDLVTDTASPDSGLTEETKEVIKKVILKQSSKASLPSIDKDIKDFSFYYSQLSPNEKQDIILYISHTLATNHENVTRIINNMPQKDVSNNPLFDKEAFIKWEEKLRSCLQPPYHWFMTQISHLSNGVKFVVDFRADLLNTLSNPNMSREDQMAVKSFDMTLKELLALWFTVGLLDLQRITWQSPCDILQKVSQYEAVHPMRNWTDLKRRVGNYRRCFVFTHSCMPDEPLVVLHTFLTNSISDSMSKIVQNQRYLSFDESSMKAGEDSSIITTAIFYSITSTQTGLKGIELGNFLIKRVVGELEAEMPNLVNFSSLSPIPGFTKWLHSNLTRAQRDEIELFAPSELEVLQSELGLVLPHDVYGELKRLLKTNSWAREDNLKAALESPLMRLCAFYLYQEKRRGYAIDPVANFHLKNGAVMWRINWNADKSPRGLDNSCGIMVNYRYFLEDCEKNSQSYVENFKISASETVCYLSKMANEIIKKK